MISSLDDFRTHPGLTAFIALLLKWNTTVNLIAAGDVPNLWTRHVADSLQLGSIAGPLPRHAIDLGSGAGFPGLILSIAFGIEVDLIEQDQRKAAFLREAVMLTGALPVSMQQGSSGRNCRLRLWSSAAPWHRFPSCCVWRSVTRRTRESACSQRAALRNRKSRKRNATGRCGSSACPVKLMPTA